MHNEADKEIHTHNGGVLLLVFCSALVGCGKLRTNVRKDSCCHKDLKSLALSSSQTCRNLIVSPDNVNWLPYVIQELWAHHSEN